MDGFLTDEVWLVVFDRQPKKSWTKKISWETMTKPTMHITHAIGG
jgi:hypothetical protein